ncbi:MAG: GTPase HflX [Vicinamibacteria bacterium]|nr:GTPase HflX [Vicinamibacteria bacterium]
MSTKARTERRERALICGTYRTSREREAAAVSLEEMSLLAKSARAEVVEVISQERKRPDAATYFGTGKVDELREIVAAGEITIVMVDTELSPVQARNLEAKLEVKVLDRTELILDIFAQRARSREGRLQVELAQLQYLMPRLTGKGVSLSRLGGGIGTRGPGETKLETDRRRIRTRVAALKESIEHVRRERATRREGRRRRAEPVVSLVGYTNAGKSSLFRALTGEEQVEISDRLFMTLDPLMRGVRIGERENIVLVDTVGFIRHLPHGLVAAFRATLEEVVEADLVLHVVDGTDPEMAEKEKAVREVLEEIGAEESPSRLVVINKIDGADDAARLALRSERPEAVQVSALTGEGLGALKQRIAEMLDLLPRPVTLRIDPLDERRIASVYRHARVISQTRDEFGQLVLEAEASPRALLAIA